MERVAAVIDIGDQLMGARYSDAAGIAEWKDDLNQAWADLLELIDTRTQMLAASRELDKFFHDCNDVLGRIIEKQNTVSDELGRDAGSVSALQRKHQHFIQVRWLPSNAVLCDAHFILIFRISNSSKSSTRCARRLDAVTSRLRRDKAREITSREAGFNCQHGDNTSNFAASCRLKMSLTFAQDRSGQLYCSRVALLRCSLVVHLPRRQGNGIVSYFSGNANSHLPP